MIARFEGRDTGAHCIDDPHAFVSENTTRCTGRHVTFQNMQIRAADGSFHHLDDRISRRLNLRLGSIFERLVPGAMVDQRFHGVFRSDSCLSLDKSRSTAPHVDFDQG